MNAGRRYFLSALYIPSLCGLFCSISQCVRSPFSFYLNTPPPSRFPPGPSYVYSVCRTSVSGWLYLHMYETKCFMGLHMGFLESPTFQSECILPRSRKLHWNSQFIAGAAVQRLRIWQIFTFMKVESLSEDASATLWVFWDAFVLQQSYKVINYGLASGREQLSSAVKGDSVKQPVWFWLNTI